MYVGRYKCRNCGAFFTRRTLDTPAWHLLGVAPERVRFHPEGVVFDTGSRILVSIPNIAAHECSHGCPMESDGNVVGLADLAGVVSVTDPYKGQYETPGILVATPKQD